MKCLLIEMRVEREIELIRVKGKLNDLLTEKSMDYLTISESLNYLL